MRNFIKKIPIAGPLLRKAYRRWINPPTPFVCSEQFWNDVYNSGGRSGPGSYGKLAGFKAEILNRFVREKKINTVIEYGCGDGNQLKLADYPSYLGFDVSDKAVKLCRKIFSSDPSKKFKLVGEYDGERAQLSLSLDVIFHLIEDGVFDDYMRRLFSSSDKYVIIYSSNTDAGFGEDQPASVRHRKFSDWIEKNEPGWKLSEHIPNKYPYKGNAKTGSFADFYVYEKTANG